MQPHAVLRLRSTTSCLTASFQKATHNETLRRVPWKLNWVPCLPCQPFSTNPHLRADDKSGQVGREQGLPDSGHEKQDSRLDDAIAQEKEKQIRTPWHRQGSNLPPVARQRSAGAMTKGKLLTTPSRLLKLILPLTTLDKNSDRKDVQPLALLVHPQQPLSYLERLIQSELPSIRNEKGEDKIPAVHFRAEDSAQDDVEESRATTQGEGQEENANQGDGLEETRFGGKVEKTGILNKTTKKAAAELRGGPGQGGVESYSGLGREGQSTSSNKGKLVRWSSSTEIGDFIRDAARGKEFAVEIEGASKEIRVGVPSFNDRTYYLRVRLRKTAGKINDMAVIKKECDLAAHKSAQYFALGGFGVLIGWWALVWALTFKTSLGWDTMEPVTYLVGLSTLVAGYAYFIYHNREISYRSAMNITISSRQSKLYEARGFDVSKWETLVDEGNAIRREIKAIAREYDVDWDETIDEQDKRVTEALRQDRRQKKPDEGEEKGEEDEQE